MFVENFCFFQQFINIMLWNSFIFNAFSLWKTCV